MRPLEFPKRVLLREDGPREGFQMLSRFVPTSEKLKLINALSETGITSIEVTSFVRPDRVPQLADAEELCKLLTARKGVRYRALYLNEQGLKRALALPVLSPEGSVMLAVSEPFLLKNNNITLNQAISALPKWLSLFDASQMRFERLMLSTAFGDQESGRISAEQTMSVCARALHSLPALPEEVTFADTTGYGDPLGVQKLIEAFRNTYPNIAVGLHLHDTRGTGMANMLAGLEVGVDRFDCSVGGLGGCPFSPGAAGNVPTEDVAYLCERMGIDTGLDLGRYIEAAKLAEEIAQVTLPGKLKSGGYA